MKITEHLTDSAMLKVLGERVERHRIEAGLTQAELAQEAGVSKRTLERIEAGQGCELVMLIRVLRVLKLSEGFNALVPELPPSPIAQLKLQGKRRRRVAHPRGASKPTPSPTGTSIPRKSWTWGEKK